ncbi:MAG: T9SS type A sorting domain-containing protein, partial [bacterium]
DNTAGALVNNNMTVLTQLELTNGIVATGSNVITIVAAAPVTRANGHVNGFLRKDFNTGPQSFNFDIGDADFYTPALLTFDEITLAGHVTANTTPSEHPDIANAGIRADRSANRYWSLVPGGGLEFVEKTYDLKLTYVETDLDPGALTQYFVVRRFDGEEWSPSANGVRTSTSTQGLGFEALSDFVVGQQDPHSIAVTSGDNQQAVIITPLANKLVVTVYDKYGIYCPDVEVSFGFGALPQNVSGMDIDPVAMVSDEFGQSRTQVVLGNKVGVYSVMASATNFQAQQLVGSPAAFELRATTGTAFSLEMVSGNSQSGATGSTLGAPLVVRVADLGGNPVQGFTVSFSFSSVPNGAAGQALSVTGAGTDPEGLLSTVVTLGDKLGTYEVLANATGLEGSPMTFTLTATSLTTVEQWQTVIPTEYSLAQNYPNPFNPSTKIRFGLPERSNVRVHVYDLMGRLVDEFFNAEQRAGFHEVVWQANGFASGTYIVRV